MLFQVISENAQKKAKLRPLLAILFDDFQIKDQFS
jgi:hypothetical protein